MLLRRQTRRRESHSNSSNTFLALVSSSTRHIASIAQTHDCPQAVRLAAVQVATDLCSRLACPASQISANSRAGGCARTAAAATSGPSPRNAWHRALALLSGRRGRVSATPADRPAPPSTPLAARSTLGIGTYGEFRPALLIVRKVPTDGLSRQLESQGVQSRPEVTDQVSDDCGEVGRNLMQNPQPIANGVLCRRVPASSRHGSFGVSHETGQRPLAVCDDDASVAARLHGSGLVVRGRRVH